MTLECVHYWEIENGKNSKAKGVCNKCGTERIFSNSLDEDWNNSKQYWHSVRDSGQSKRARQSLLSSRRKPMYIPI